MRWISSSQDLALGTDCVSASVRELAGSKPTSSEHFSRLRLSFAGLNGRRLQLVDCQNLFCEVDKYARLAHPEITGYSGRTRIKRRFTPVDTALTSWFPPKWGISDLSPTM